MALAYIPFSLPVRAVWDRNLRYGTRIWLGGRELLCAIDFSPLLSLTAIDSTRCSNLLVRQLTTTASNHYNDFPVHITDRA